MAVEIARRRFTVDEYHRMGEAGILREDDRVELIDGEIVEMTPIGSRDAAAVTRLNQSFVRALGEKAMVSVRNPLPVPPRSEPQPDVMLLRPRPDFYSRAHPGPQDVWLVVEVADTQLTFDRAVKVPLYAGARIQEVWVVNLPGQSVEVYRHPADGHYGEMEKHEPGQRIMCAAFPDLLLSVDDVLGTP